MNNPRQILKLVGIGFGLAALVVVSVGLLLPREFTLQRSVVMEADPAAIHAQVGRLDRWERWASWLRDDPSLTVQPGPLVEGPGATLTWNNETGGGEMEIIRSEAERGVDFAMTLGRKQQQVTSNIQYRTLTPTAAGVPRTEVLWQLHGDSGWDLMGRYFNLLLDPLMGPMLEDGLQRLKMLAEGDAGVAGARVDTLGNPADQ